MQQLGSNMTMLGAPFLAFGGVAVAAASKSQDALANLDATLKSTGGAAGVTEEQAVSLAEGFQKVTKFSKENTEAGEAMLLTFTNIGKDVFPDATKAMLNLATKMKTDAVGSSIQLGKALNDPIKGITALTRVGVSFTQQQKDQIKAMVEAGNTMGAQKIILTELDKEFGGQATAAGATFSGQLDITKNRLNEVMVTIGEKLMPIADKFLGWIGDAVTAFTNMSPTLQDIIVGVIAFMAALAVIGPVIGVLGTVIATVGGILSSAFLVPIGLVVGAIAGLYLAFQNNFLGIRDLLKPIFDKIGDFFAHFSDNVKLYGSLILLFAQYYFQGVVEAIQKIIDKIVDFLAQNPKLVEAIVVVGGVLLVLGGVMLASSVLAGVFSGAMAALGVVVGIGSTLLTGIGAFIALLTGPLGLVALLIALVGAVIIAYPGGLPGLLKDAAKSFELLVKTIDAAFLTWIKNLAQEFHNLAIALGLATDASGKWKANGLTNSGGGNINFGGGGSGGGSVTFRDSGGSGRAGSAYMIGRGAQPEMFIPSTNGTFVPNADKMMGGTTINIQSMPIYASGTAEGAAAGEAATNVLDEWIGRGNK